VQLQEKSETRKQTGTFLMGKREISIAIKGGYKRKRYCFYLKFVRNGCQNIIQNAELIEINKGEYQKL
jgi:hypothetical protein